MVVAPSRAPRMCRLAALVVALAGCGGGDDGPNTVGFAQQPTDQSIDYGSDVTFTVQADGAGSGPVTYQWYRDGSPVSGEVSDAFTFGPVTHADDGAQIYCVIGDDNGTTQSVAAVLTVVAVLNVMDIVDARALYIEDLSGVIPPTSLKGVDGSRSSGRSRKTPPDASALFKVTSTGAVLEVSCVDSAGATVTSEFTPSHIFDVNETYVMITFAPADPGDPQESGYLVRKSDGSVFSFGDTWVPMPNVATFANTSTRTFTDASGNIYYFTEEFADGEWYGRVIKIDVSDPMNLTAERYSFETDFVGHFVVDAGANCAYDHGAAGLGFVDHRLRKASGGAQNIPGAVWLGPDGGLYLTQGSGVKELCIDAGYNVTYEDYGDPFLGANVSISGYRLELAGRLLFVTGGIVEVYNPEGQPRAIDASAFGVTSIDMAGASNDYYYLAGTDALLQPVLVRVDPTDDSHANHLPPNTYEIHEMRVSSSDVIMFTALRMADGARVVGEIDAGGSVTLHDEDLNDDLVALELVNGPADALVFGVQPSHGVCGEALHPAISVQLQDAFGNRVSSAMDTVTLAIDANPASGALSGTVSVDAVGGTAVFNDLSIDTVGAGYTLRATSGALTAAVSDPFNLVAHRLVFETQPATADAGATMATITVEARDGTGAVDASFAGDVTIAIGDNPAAGSLSGTLTVTISSGAASFSDLSIDQPGQGYTLTATAPGVLPDESERFEITTP